MIGMVASVIVKYLTYTYYNWVTLFISGIDFKSATDFRLRNCGKLYYVGSARTSQSPPCVRPWPRRRGSVKAVFRRHLLQWMSGRRASERRGGRRRRRRAILGRSSEGAKPRPAFSISPSAVVGSRRVHSGTAPHFILGPVYNERHEAFLFY